jgi:hypothetical protein
VRLQLDPSKNLNPLLAFQQDPVPQQSNFRPPCVAVVVRSRAPATAALAHEPNLVINSIHEHHLNMSCMLAVLAELRGD